LESFRCEWLPDTIEFNDYQDWNSYEEVLYQIFINDFVQSHPLLNDKPVKIRKHPMILGKEQTFFHITSVDQTFNPKDPNDRIPDLNRSARLSWVRKIIENYMCRKGCCSFIKVWREKYKSYERIHMLFEEVRFMVVVEERETYNLLITAYYIEHDHQLKKKLKKYERYQKQKTPLIP
jgi:hypothetical protein